MSDCTFSLGVLFLILLLFWLNFSCVKPSGPDCSAVWEQTHFGCITHRIWRSSLDKGQRFVFPTIRVAEWKNWHQWSRLIKNSSCSSTFWWCDGRRDSPRWQFSRQVVTPFLAPLLTHTHKHTHFRKQGSRKNAYRGWIYHQGWQSEAPRDPVCQRAFSMCRIKHS